MWLYALDIHFYFFPMPVSIDESILRNFGGLSKNNLENVIQSCLVDEDDDDDMSNIKLTSSSYFTHDILSETLHTRKGYFNILSLNCQSINAKFDKILLLVTELKLKQNSFFFDAICLQETWLEEGADLSVFELEDYSCIARGKYCSEHGGLITYVHKKYDFTLYTIPVQSNIWEGLFISILNNKKNSKNLYICNVYRPPKDNLTADILNNFLHELNPVLSVLNKSKSIILLAADFNIDLLKINDRVISKDFLNNMFSQGFYPTIILPTRLTDNSSTLIDNVFININDNSQSSGILLSNMSDHFPYFHSFQFEHVYETDKIKYTYRRNINENSFKNLYDDLLNIDFSNILNHDLSLDPNLNYNILENILITSLDKHMPMRKMKFNKHKHKKSNWITNGIIKSIKFRDNLYKRTKQTSQNSIEFVNLKQNLSVYNKILKKLIKEAKFSYYNNNFAKHRSDTRKTWDMINQIIKKPNCKHFPDYFTINDKKVNGTKVIADHFNSFFQQIGTNMASKIPKVNEYKFKDYFTNNTNTHFKFKLIDKHYVTHIIKKLNCKTSFGYDGLSTKLLKQLEPILSGPISLIVNQSLKTGIFPDKLKLAKITPIFKKR